MNPVNRTGPVDAQNGRDQAARDFSAAVDQRLTELEIKASFGEETIDRLNDVIVRQQQQIDELNRAVAALQLQIEQLPAAGFRSLRDDLPPHF